MKSLQTLTNAFCLISLFMFPFEKKSDRHALSTYSTHETIPEFRK